jgi:hypothetical protein
MTMNKDAFMAALKTKLNGGNIIGKAAFDKVIQIITGLKEQLAQAHSGSNKAIAMSAASVEEATKATAAATASAAEAGKRADDAQDALAEQMEAMSRMREVSGAQLIELTETMNAAKDAADRQVKKLEAVIASLEEDNKQLTLEKGAEAEEMGRVFAEALKQIDKALSVQSDVDVFFQRGGFQSSSSGNYDYKKYRSSSRSYSNKIKGLKKKRKQSKKERKQSKKRRRDRKKKSKHNKTRKH